MLLLFLILNSCRYGNESYSNIVSNNIIINSTGNVDGAPTHFGLPILAVG